MADHDGSNGSRLWRWKKIDILFLAGIGVIVYGTATAHVEVIVAGAGIAGLPLTLRGDKAP